MMSVRATLFFQAVLNERLAAELEFRAAVLRADAQRMQTQAGGFPEEVEVPDDPTLRC